MPSHEKKDHTPKFNTKHPEPAKPYKTFQNRLFEKEKDPARLAQRAKQVEFGKNTIGYQNYVNAIPRKQRKPREHPQTPDIHRQYSKRAWDGIVRKWRRQLHEWDVLGPNGEPMGSQAADAAVSSAQELSELDKEIDAFAASLPLADEDAGEMDEDDLAALDAQLSEFQ